MNLVYYILYLALNFIVFIGDVGEYILKFLWNFVFVWPKQYTSIILAKARQVRLKSSEKLRFSLRLPRLSWFTAKRTLAFTPLAKPSKKRPPRKSILRLEYFIIGFIFALIIVGSQEAYDFVRRLPSPRAIGKVNYSLTSHIYDRNGKLLYDVYRDQNRTPVKLKDLPTYVYQAAIAIEDKDFFSHRGISLVGGIGRAIKESIVTGKVQGGSTITQQLIKSSLLSPERTLERKFKEIILALWAERLYTKNQILEMYLNQVPYGGSAYGIEEAAKTFYGKSARELTVDEAATLAGLPQAPSVYSPYTNPTLTKQRRNDVLVKMRDQGYIKKDSYEQAKAKEIEVLPPTNFIKAPHFVFYVRNKIEEIFGTHSIEEGGLRVRTTIDLTLQQKTEEILKEELDKVRHLNITNGAVLITRPTTGEILAMVGSVDYFEQPYGAYNVTTANRQPGSSIKPLMYSLALDRGQTAATIIDDTPVAYSNQWGEVYRPINYDGRFHGRTPLRFALANSYNIPAVRTLNTLGVDAFVNHARTMGISTWNDSSRFGLSLTLGGGEVTMVDMAKAYGVFANLGKRVELDPFVNVANFNDETLYSHIMVERKVLSEGASYIISDILADNIARQQAFGARSQLEVPGYQVAVKTGTTDDKKDNWTIGYTPEYLVTVWVGNNDNTPMNQALTSGVTGAAPIWNRVMTHLLTTYSTKNSWFNKPSDIVEKNCYGTRKEYFLKGTEGTFCQTRISPTPTVKPN